MTDIGFDSTEDPFAIPLATDPDTIRDEQTLAIQALIPDWRPVSGTLAANLLGAAAETDAETRQAIVDRMRSDLLSIVGSLFGTPRQDGVGAESTMTVAATDALGHTLAVDTTVYLGDIELRTTDELVIPVTETEGTVGLQAIDPTATINGATGPLEIDPLDWIDTVTLDDPLAGGAEPETDLEYSVRIAEQNQTLSPRLVLAADGVILARRHPSVGWAYGLNLYNPVTDTFGNAKTFTIVIADPAGLALPGGVLTEVDDELQALREANFNIFTRNPTYTTVDVTAEIVPHADFEPTDAAAAAAAALEARVSPVGWLSPPYSLDASFVPIRRIHVNELIAIADQADGVDYVESLIIGDGSSDYIDLPTPIDLPIPGDIVVTPA